jgi:hypothetical protein
VIQTYVDIPTGSVPTEELVEDCCGALGLTISMKGRLASCPGSVHWHLKRGRETGTIEATLWPARQRLWLSVHTNRAAGWTQAAMEELHAALTARLQRADEG